jgi:hypothetical protein
MRTLITATLLASLLAVAAHAQTWLTDPAFGARRDAYGPGVHMDATGRAYGDAPRMPGSSSPCRKMSRTKRVFVLCASQPSARRVYQPAALSVSVSHPCARSLTPERQIAAPAPGESPESESFSETIIWGHDGSSVQWDTRTLTRWPVDPPTAQGPFAGPAHVNRWSTTARRR